MSADQANPAVPAYAKPSAAANAARHMGAARRPAFAWLRGCVPVLLLVAVFTAFEPALEGEFLSRDDDKLLQTNPAYRGFSPEHPRWMWTTRAGGHWQPLTWLNHALEHALYRAGVWPLETVGLHVTNTLLHALSGVLFYFVALRLLVAARQDPNRAGSIHPRRNIKSFARERATLISLTLLSVCAGEGCAKREASAPRNALPARIVTLAPNSDELLCALGVGDRIVGVSRFTLYPPELADRARIGGPADPDLERIVALHPDFVVLRGKCEPVEELCRRRNIELFRDPTENLADLLRCIRDLGARLGKSREAEALARTFQQRLRDIETEAELRRAGGARPRVLLTLSRSPEGLGNIMTSAKGTLHDEIIRLAGGENVFGQLEVKYPVVSLEEIVARAPDVIVELMPGLRLDPARRETLIAQWQALGPVPACRDERIFVLGDEYDYSLVPSLRSATVIEKMRDLLYPAMPKRRDE